MDQDYVPGVTTAEPPVVQNFLPRTTIGVSGELVSRNFSLAGYTAADLPNLFLDYTNTGTFEIFVRRANNTETRIGTTQTALPILFNGTNSTKLSLGAFAGEEDLSIIFRNPAGSTTIDNIVIGFSERGEQIGAGNEPTLLAGFPLSTSIVRSTRTFSLDTYTFADNPQVTFGYQVLQGDLDVFVIDQFGNQTRIATSNANDVVLAAGEVLLTRGSLQTATLSCVTGRMSLVCASNSAREPTIRRLALSTKSP